VAFAAFTELEVVIAELVFGSIAEPLSEVPLFVGGAANTLEQL